MKTIENVKAKEFGELLKRYRERRGITRKALAEQAGVMPQTLYQWENGTREPTLTRAAAVMSKLGYTLLFVRKDSALLQEYKEREK